MNVRVGDIPKRRYVKKYRFIRAPANWQDKQRVFDAPYTNVTIARCDGF